MSSTVKMYVKQCRVISHYRLSCKIPSILFTCLILSSLWLNVESHGRLIKPPGRSSAWRYDFPSPPNYNDHELYCGGFSRQWQRNGGKCGPCGDAWDSPQPRPNEAGGKYGLGIIVEEWKVGDVVEIQVQLTANHMGYFEFRICPHNNKKQPVSNACLDQNILIMANGNGSRYYPSSGARIFKPRYRLPSDMTCSQCVLQWRYIAGNNWGMCDNGKGAVGCGPQEQFRACADVKISKSDGSANDIPSNIPEYPDHEYSPEYPGPDEDYNEVDVDTRTSTYPKKFHVLTNHAGHIVALTLAFLLTFAVLVGMIVYFYWARDIVKDFIRKRKFKWMHTKPPSITVPFPGKKLTFFHSETPPPIPPRRNKPAISEPTVPQKHIRTISSPTKVTINGIEVKPSQSPTQTSLHVPDN